MGITVKNEPTLKKHYKGQVAALKSELGLTNPMRIPALKKVKAMRRRISRRLKALSTT